MTINVSHFRGNRVYFSPVNNLNFYHATQLFSRCESWRQHFIKKLGFDSFCNDFLFRAKTAKSPAFGRDFWQQVQTTPVVMVSLQV